MSQMLQDCAWREVRTEWVSEAIKRKIEAWPWGATESYGRRV